MGRLSILGMMGLISLVAIGLAALRNANDAWAGLLLLVTLGLVGVAVLGVVHRRGRARAGWLGFVVFSGGYLSLVFGPGLSDRFEPRLGTSTLLGHVQSLATPSPRPGEMIQVALAEERGRLVARLSHYRRLVRSPSDPAIRNIDRMLKQVNLQIAQESISAAEPNRWRSILPGAAHRDQFMQVGHCLFALLAGAVGAIISARFHRVDLAEPMDARSR